MPGTRPGTANNVLLPDELDHVALDILSERFEGLGDDALRIAGQRHVHYDSVPARPRSVTHHRRKLVG